MKKIKEVIKHMESIDPVTGETKEIIDIFKDENGELVTRYHKRIKGDVEPIEKEEFFKLHPKVLFASIPDNISDNDPILNEKMQAIYDKEFTDFNIQFTGADISCLENEFIKEQVHKLTEYPSTLHSRQERIKVNRYLHFLEKKEKAVKIIIPLPPWTQELIALDCVYTKTTIQESNREAIAKQYKKPDGQSVSGSQNLVKLYNEFEIKIVRYAKPIEMSNKSDAARILKQLRKLQLLIEDREATGSGPHEKLLLDIEKIDKNLGLI